MKAPDFNYKRPTTLAAALAFLDNDELETQVLAGGQSLMPMMNFRLATPDALIDLNALDELNFINETGNTIEIGAMTRYATLLQSPLIKQHVPLFMAAIPHIAHSAIRNRGTIGGSAALADPAAEMPALLITLSAHLILTSTKGERSVAAEDFFTGIYETLLNDNEIIQTIVIEKPKTNSQYGFYEVTRRHGDYAIAGVAVAAASTDPLHDLRIVFFGVSDCATRATSCEQALEGTSIGDSQSLEKAISTLAEIEYVDDLHTSIAAKQHMAGVVLRRALQEIPS